MEVHPTSRRRIFGLCLVGVAAFLLGGAGEVRGIGDNASMRASRQQFMASLQSPPMLRAFLYRMPKGADLHSHVSGAVYAEALIQAGAERGLCVNEKSAAVSLPPCDAEKGSQPIANAMHNGGLDARLVDAWSMRGFQPSNGISGHDHFFAAFGLFGGVADVGTMVADIADRAGRQQVQYLELMVTFQGAAVREIAAKTPWNPDMSAMRASLIAAGLPAVVEQAKADLATVNAKLQTLLKCDTALATAGCRVKIRFLQQVGRIATPASVFAQTLFAFLLADAGTQVVGINFVGAEDDPAVLVEYPLQMQIVEYMRSVMPNVNVALHAGELTLGDVAPKQLRSHIRQAVEVARAKRIGHGVDLMYEDDPYGLMREMAARRVAVEVNLTSNDQILGVSGNQHPFPIYLAAHVPVVLSTDDEGIERTDITHELQRAVLTYHLDYDTLIGLERNSLEYSFLPGPSLWADVTRWRTVPACAGADLSRDPTGSCAAFLKGSDRAQMQWQLEARLRQFEKENATQKHGLHP